MRPLKYGEEMTQINIRVPKSKVKDIQKLVADYLKGFEHGSEITNSAKTTKPEFIYTTGKPKWQIDAEERMKRNK